MVQEETEVEGGIRLSSACCIVYILSSYGVRFPLHVSTKLMMALLVKPSNATRKCADYDQLVTVHLVSDHWRRFVQTCLYLTFATVISSFKPCSHTRMESLLWMPTCSQSQASVSNSLVSVNNSSQLVDTFKDP